MSVKSFKFVSPGVFINEIDNSFIPKSADTIGPVIIGRASRGIAMEPVKINSYSEFVNAFGDTVPGNAGGDVYRRGNYQSPMYGTYAAKAFLRSNVAPLTYFRLLGYQHTNADTTVAAAQAGWKTDADPASTLQANGGAFGLWIFPSASVTYNVAGVGDWVTGGSVGLTGSSLNLGTGSLAAVWYCNSGSAVLLSGSCPNLVQGTSASGSGPATVNAKNICANGAVISSDSNGLFTVRVVTASAGVHGTVEDQTVEEVKFGFDDGSENFARKVFNTDPQLCSTKGAFFPASAHKQYWLGESFAQYLAAGGSTAANGAVEGTTLVGKAAYGVMLPIAKYGDKDAGPANFLGNDAKEAAAGWFIGQDVGDSGTYTPERCQKLFRLLGRGHGGWISKNLKVSIEQVKVSTSLMSDYGSFSVVVRMLTDTDNKVQVVERYDNCNLDPASPDYIGRKIGTRYASWSDTTRRLSYYGQYPNNSKYIRVEMNNDVDAGSTDASLIPFGYYGPANFKDIGAKTGGRPTQWSGTLTAGSVLTNNYMWGGTSPHTASETMWLSGAQSDTAGYGSVWLSASAILGWPTQRLRLSASDGGFADPTNAYFGFSSRRDNASTRPDPSIISTCRALYGGIASDTSAGGIAGVNGFSYIFSLDDVRIDASGNYYYQSGSRNAGNSISATSGKTYKDLLSADYNRFTAPFVGGTDGLNIKLPDPFYNEGMKGATVSQTTNMAYNVIKRAIDSLADPEFVNINMMSMPGLTKDGLTTHMVDVCQERADSLAVIDLPNVYLPNHEVYKASETDRVSNDPVAIATALRNRRMDSSYGCTFYPWVQTRDARSGQLLWIPPSVAMLGTFASSQASSQVWFAPAGFNRGGLTEGAAGIPIVNVSERVISKHRDTLYENNINPIASFPSSGIVVFGQKTLQARRSALDRINVRRLVIYMKKEISVLSTRVLFEQNVPSTWNRFKSLVEPFLANVKTEFGITDYKLILDESTTTADLIDQNIMYAKIMIKPARAIEYIAIDFVIASTGASFDD